MALLALFLPVVLLGALLGLERVETWTTSSRPRTPTGPAPSAPALPERVAEVAVHAA